MLRHPRVFLTSALVLAIIPTFASHHAVGQEEPTVAAQAQLVPQLSFEQRQHEGDERVFTMAQIAIPVRTPASAMDDFKCEIWCYEDRFGTGEAEMQEDGSLLLTHTHEGVTLKTHLVAEPGAVVFNVEATGDDPEQVKKVRSVNPCWQLRASDAFGNRGDFYQDFVSRCFIYTVRGLTLMKDTTRFPDSRRPADDPRNSPPWVQVYLPIWRRHGGQPEAFWGSSTDRPIYSLIGCVSRDGKYLTAFGWPKSGALSQGWHDCLHTGPDFSGFYDSEANKVVCHGKLYFMENDPDALLAKYLADFPQPEPALTIQPLGEGVVSFAHRDLPDHVVEALDLPRDWQQTPWGTWTGSKQLGEITLAYWLRAHGEFINAYMTARNGTPDPVRLRLDVPLAASEGWGEPQRHGNQVWLTRDDGWLGAGVWERTEFDVPAGEQVTVRARIRMLQGTLDDLLKLLEEDAAEWQRATPYRLPIDAEDRD